MAATHHGSSIVKEHHHQLCTLEHIYQLPILRPTMMKRLLEAAL